MDALFSRLSLADVHRDVARNIVSLRTSQDLFDDLSSAPEDWRLAQQVEDAVKPPPYTSAEPAIHRPFEDAAWFAAIDWPFRHWQASRFSDGSFGVWYGSESVETTAWETAYHWVNGLLRDAGFDAERVVAERRVYSVACDALLPDFRGTSAAHRKLLHKRDYAHAQAVGARLHREGHPGLVVGSARRDGGENFVVFNPGVLSRPRHACYLTYRLESERVVVERTPGRKWLEIPRALL